MRAPAVFACLLGAALLACRGEEPPQVAVDLGTLVASAEPWRETGALDLRTVEGRRALLSGWSAVRWGTGDDLLWSQTRGSQLAFHRSGSGDFRLQLRGLAPQAGAAGWLVAVAVNGTEVGRVRLGNTMERVELSVPAASAPPGRNQLELAFPEAAGSDEKATAVAWRGFRFGELEAAPGSARAGPAPGSLVLPAGTGLDFYLELSGGERLVLEGVGALGGTRLEADLECDGEAPRRDLVAAGGGDEIDLDTRSRSAPTPCRLALRAPAVARPGAESAVTVARARVLLPARTPAPAGPAPAPPAAAPPRNFLVYIVDTLRADRLGCYGFSRPLTPAIDAFSRQAVLFEHARAQSSYTRPTVATMLTGETPARLGVAGRFERVPAEVETLAERLSAKGFRTAYVTSNPNTAAAFGFEQGIDFFEEVWKHDAKEAISHWSEVHAAGRKFLDGLGATDRFFLVLHTVEPHAPYLPSSHNRKRWAADADPKLGVRRILDGLPRRRPNADTVRQVRELYDAEVADTDEGFADLLAELERRGRLDDTAVLLISDHGEELFEHGNVQHGRTLFEEQLRIPMIWRLPGGQGGGRRIASRVDQLDVTPTVLELAGIAPPAEMPGRSLARALAGGAPPAEVPSPAWLKRLHWHQESLVDGDFKLIRNLKPLRGLALSHELLYHLKRDAAEQNPTIVGSEVRAGFLRAQLRYWTVRSGPTLEGGDAEVDEQLRRELAALGYLN